MASTLKVNTIQGASNTATAIKTNGGTDALTIDTSGRVLLPQRPQFKVQRTGNTDMGSSAANDKIVGFDDVSTSGTINVGGFWSTANQRATAPVTGMYHFEIHAYTLTGTTGQIGIGLYVNGATAKGRDFRLNYDESGYTSVNFCSSVYLAANDYVEFYFIQQSGGGTLHLSSGQYYGGVAGYLIG